MDAETILAAAKIMDEQRVPTTGRFIRYIDEDGNLVEMEMDTRKITILESGDDRTTDRR